MDPLWREVEVARDGIDSFAGDGREMEAFERLVVDRARLRRIEEAARKVDREAGLQGSAKGMTAALRELHSALNQEVKG